MKFLLGMLLGYLLALFIIFVMPHNKKEFTFPQLELSQVDSIPKLTKENVLKEIIKQDIKFPLIVYRQVLWETGHLKCKNCSLDYLNIFGYGWNGKTYHKYTDWRESIKAYKTWQIKYYKKGDYYQFLENIGYATDETYIQKLQSIKI